MAPNSIDIAQLMNRHLGSAPSHPKNDAPMTSSPAVSYRQFLSDSNLTKAYIVHTAKEGPNAPGTYFLKITLDGLEFRLSTATGLFKLEYPFSDHGVIVNGRPSSKGPAELEKIIRKVAADLKAKTATIVGS